MELSDYRKELDSIDAQMLELFKQRMNTVRGVAEYKKEKGGVIPSLFFILQYPTG